MMMKQLGLCLMLMLFGVNGKYAVLAEGDFDSDYGLYKGVIRKRRVGYTRVTHPYNNLRHCFLGKKKGTDEVKLYYGNEPKTMIHVGGEFTADEKSITNVKGFFNATNLHFFTKDKLNKVRRAVCWNKNGYPFFPNWPRSRISTGEEVRNPPTNKPFVLAVLAVLPGGSASKYEDTKRYLFELGITQEESLEWLSKLHKAGATLDDNLKAAVKALNSKLLEKKKAKAKDQRSQIISKEFGIILEQDDIDEKQNYGEHLQCSCCKLDLEENDEVAKITCIKQDGVKKIHYVHSESDLKPGKMAMYVQDNTSTVVQIIKVMVDRAKVTAEEYTLSKGQKDKQQKLNKDEQVTVLTAIKAKVTHVDIMTDNGVSHTVPRLIWDKYFTLLDPQGRVEVLIPPRANEKRLTEVSEIVSKHKLKSMGDTIHVPKVNDNDCYWKYYGTYSYC